MTHFSTHLQAEWSPVGWTLRFTTAQEGPMRLPLTLQWQDGEALLDAALLSTSEFPVRHVWMNSRQGATETWLRHLEVPDQALDAPFEGIFESQLAKRTELALTAAARARFLGVTEPVPWPEGLPAPGMLGARDCPIEQAPEQPLEWCHPATAPLGLRLGELPSVEPIEGKDLVRVAVPGGADAADVAAALITGGEVLSSTLLSVDGGLWNGSLPLYGHALDEVHLDVFDPQVGAGLPPDSRPKAWAAMRDFARGYWRVELPDRGQSVLAVVVSNAAGDSTEVLPLVKRSGEPATRRLALAKLRCAWYAEGLHRGACAVDLALAYLGLNDSASAWQVVTGEGMDWLLEATDAAADRNSPRLQRALSKACEELTDLAPPRLAEALRARSELLVARPQLESELRDVLQREPARVLGAPHGTAFDKGLMWAESRQRLLAQDWNGDEPDRPLLAEMWAAEGE